MNISKIFSAQLYGLSTHIISIEVDLSNGLHSFSIVGLGDKAIDESKDRISAAIKNTGYISPKQKNQKVVISLAPADIRKEGPSFDLGMALAYLVASGDIDFDPKDRIFLGELSLSGEIRKVSGILPLIRGVKDMGYKEVYIPIDNSEEAGLVNNINIYPCRNLNEIINHLTKDNYKIKKLNKTQIQYTRNASEYDFNMIHGQEIAKRALEIAASGGHNVAMYGPPGTGKTMLARAFQTILPDLSEDEMLEVTSIHSISKILDKPIIRPPFRSPHHTASYASLIGGGSYPQPGEISLAHRGVLFLDEFPEFDRKVIESLRQPLEEHKITISRAKGTLTFPAKCILIASMNPCPCGFGNTNRCKCNDKDTNEYRKRISGPIIDRIDMWIQVSKIDYDKLSSKLEINEKSKDIKERVENARKIQFERFNNMRINKKYNSEMTISDIENCIKIDTDANIILKNSSEKLGLSARSYHRIIKLSQTIADLDNSTTIKKDHILEAIQYRQKSI